MGYTELRDRGITLVEIDENIEKYRKMKSDAEKTMADKIEFIEFKRSQNGVDSVEVQNINEVIQNLQSIIQYCNNEIEYYQRLKLSCCERKVMSSKLRSNFYGY